MNILTLPELFSLISINLNDKEKIFLTSCSKIIHNFKSLIILDSEYNLEEIYNKWNAKNIIIKDFSLEDKIKELIKNAIQESIVSYLQYAEFISNNINIKLFYNQETIEKIISYGCHYMVIKIILNNGESIEKISNQFRLKKSEECFLYIIKEFIDMGADIYTKDNYGIVWNANKAYLSVV